MTHEELALRIEALDGPDRLMDVEVENFLGLAKFKRQPEGFGDADMIRIKPMFLTSSLDAAASLMPEGWTVHEIAQGGYGAFVKASDGNWNGIQATAKTECLARLAAAVRAHGKELNQ